jgi:hypothetical protein
MQGEYMSSAPPRQGIIHARPGKTGAAPQLYRGTEGIRTRLCLPQELRNSCGARQGKAESCLRQNCIDMLVCFLRFMRRGRDRFSAPPERRDLRAVAKVAWRAPSMLHGTQGRALELPSWKGYDG